MKRPSQQIDVLCARVHHIIMIAGAGAGGGLPLWSFQIISIIFPFASFYSIIVIFSFHKMSSAAHSWSVETSMTPALSYCMSRYT